MCTAHLYAALYKIELQGKHRNLEETQRRHLDRLKLRLVEASCATCVPAIRRQLEKVKGVEWVGANPVLDLIFVDYDPDLIDTDEILQVVKRSGYTAVRASA